MARSGSETRQRTKKRTACVTEEQAVEIDARADAAGLSVSAYMSDMALSARPPRNKRLTKAEVRLLSQNLAYLALVATELKDLKEDEAFAEIKELIEAVLRDQAEMRNLIMEILGRKP